MIQILIKHFNILVLKLYLGNNLEDLFRPCHCKDKRLEVRLV